MVGFGTVRTQFRLTSILVIAWDSGKGLLLHATGILRLWPTFDLYAPETLLYTLANYGNHNRLHTEVVFLILRR